MDNTTATPTPRTPHGHERTCAYLDNASNDCNCMNAEEHDRYLAWLEQRSARPMNLIMEHGTATIPATLRQNTPFRVHTPPEDCMYDGNAELLVVGGLRITKFLPPANYTTELMVEIFEEGHPDVSEGLADLKIEHLDERNRYYVSFSAETKGSCLQALRDLISVVMALPAVGVCEFETSEDGKEAV